MILKILLSLLIGSFSYIKTFDLTELERLFLMKCNEKYDYWQWNEYYQFYEENKEILLPIIIRISQEIEKSQEAKYSRII